ncbi:MAG: hypothetical protein M1833_005194 [Piccolia ochrophora]|nr:MAG: hypothetical protein M1833_005194 [Piccolia ochrophora]
MDLDETDDPTAKWLSITGQPLDLDLPNGFFGSCTPVSDFTRLNQLGEGSKNALETHPEIRFQHPNVPPPAYGVVSRAQDTRTSKIIALKQVRIGEQERRDGIPITALREISILRSLNHPNVVDVFDVAVGAGSLPPPRGERAKAHSPLDEIHMVMEYAEQDLANLMDELGVTYRLSEVKCLFRQLLEGLEYLHRNDIIHRDLKLQNLLLTSRGVLKIADFGMARVYSPRPLTAGVVTIWYRAPEILLGTSRYDPSIDLWSAGLILGELLLSEPILPGERTLEQLALTVKLLGTPTKSDLASYSAMGCPELISWQRDSLVHGRVDNLERHFRDRTSPQTVSVLTGLLRWDPHARWTASEGLGKGRSKSAEQAERWWRESPREIGRELMPTFPEVRNEQRVEELPAGGSRGIDAASGKHENEGYVFDFGGEATIASGRGDPKRHRAW